MVQKSENFLFDSQLPKLNNLVRHIYKRVNILGEEKVYIGEMILYY